jgi:hypothetical protein
LSRLRVGGCQQQMRPLQIWEARCNGEWAFRTFCGAGAG